MPEQRKENPKVMHVVLTLGAGGGAESVVYDLVRDRELAAVPPVVCCIQAVGAQGGLLQQEGFRVFCRTRKPGFDRSLIGWLAQMMRQERVDVVHAHQYTPMFYSVPAALLAGRVRVVYTEHGRLHPDRRVLKRCVVNPFLALGIDCLVSISNSTRAAMAHYDMMPGRRITVIHNGVDTMTMNPPLDRAKKRLEIGVSDHCRIVGMAARLEEIKNIPMALRAFRKVLESFPDSCFVIAGFGSGEEKLKEYARSLGIAEQVRFLGLRDDLPELYQLMDVFVLSSFTEGISITLLEAMASGVPAVATLVGGNPEVVVDGVTGYLIPLGDDEGMAERIATLLRDSDLASRLGEKGRARVEESFSLPAMTAAYRALYRGERALQPIAAAGCTAA